MGTCVGLSGVHGREKQRVNGPLCMGMNGAPDEGDTHQLALMTSHFLLKQSLPPHIHMLTHSCWHLPKDVNRRTEALGWGVG